MANLLRTYGLENQVRNNRGLLPIEMNHDKEKMMAFVGETQKIEEKDEISYTLQDSIKPESIDSKNKFDLEPDYLFVVKQYMAEFLIKQLVNLNLMVTEVKSKHYNK